MAKRKRLILGDLPSAAPEPAEAPALFPLGAARSSPPIARVAGEASALSALSDLAGEMASARDSGRMIQSLPLETIEADYLVRDRMGADDAELEVLMQSLRVRGQQVPIEVAALPGQDHQGDRYGLISGWRRLNALRRLHTEAPTDPRFASVLAILRKPEAASEAYLAMVEENEIRVALSYYERARIVARAAEQGVFADTSTALSQLFAAASRAKRSKIGSFLRIVASLDDRLRFAAHIPERLGLTLSRALEADPTFAARLRDRLRKTPAESAEAELAALEKSLIAAKPADQAGTESHIPTEANSAPPLASGLAAEGTDRTRDPASDSTSDAVASPPSKPVPPTPDHTPTAVSEPVSKVAPPPEAFPRNPADWPPPPIPGTQELPGVYVETGFGFVTLRGPKVTAYFQTQLITLLSHIRD